MPTFSEATQSCLQKGGRTSPSPGQVVRQESSAPKLPLNPAGFPRVPPVAPAHLLLSLSLWVTSVRSEMHSEEDFDLEEYKPTQKG